MRVKIHEYYWETHEDLVHKLKDKEKENYLIVIPNLVYRAEKRPIGEIDLVGLVDVFADFYEVKCSDTHENYNHAVNQLWKARNYLNGTFYVRNCYFVSSDLEKRLVDFRKKLR